MSTPHGTIETHVTGSIGRLVVTNEVRRNAVSLAMWRAIPEAVARLDGDPRVRVIILRGAGHAAFVSGADISEFATVRRDADSGRAYEAANEEAFAALAGAAKPTIAAIHGACMGGGLGLALACDIRIASEDAVFAIPAARLGVGYPPGAMAQVVTALGSQTAKLLFYTAKRIHADEAFRLGLLAETVTKGALDGRVEELAHEIATGAPLTLAAAKRAIDAAAGTRPASLDQLRALADACFDSADYAEGRAAFLEKRAPRFEGR